jgi:hypothetical protein
MASRVAAAFILDRAAQYTEESGVRMALEEVANSILLLEHIEAFEHGELDDLLQKQTNRSKRKGSQ